VLKKYKGSTFRGLPLKFHEVSIKAGRDGEGVYLYIPKRMFPNRLHSNINLAFDEKTFDIHVSFQDSGLLMGDVANSKKRGGVDYSLVGFLREFELEPEDLLGRYVVEENETGFNIIYMTRVRGDYRGVVRVKKTLVMPKEEFDEWMKVRAEHYPSLSNSRFIRLAVNRWKEDYFP